ncbi:MAG TPA: hypothetical protein PKL53_08640 [Methylotenera sp.]|nr:hypothetical protein [Methylotenera sp.]HPV45289.1 hypothetical protein [Methylotenera sp.]
MLVKKSQLMQIRLEPVLYSKLQAVAAARNFTLSRMVRELIELECDSHLKNNVALKTVNRLPKSSFSKKPSKAKVITGRNGVNASSLLSTLLNKSV